MARQKLRKKLKKIFLISQKSGMIFSEIWKSR